MEGRANTVITWESLTGRLTRLHLLLACSYFVFMDHDLQARPPHWAKGQRH